MGMRTVDIAAILLNLAYCAYSDHILSCNVTALYPCPGAHQICIEQTGQCTCKEGFVLEGSECEPANSEPPSHTLTAVIVTIFTLALLICGIVLVFRKYDLLNHIRQRILRRNNDVMYEDVMIGQDDPPLSP